MEGCKMSNSMYLFTWGCITSPSGQAQPVRSGASGLQLSRPSQVELQSLMSVR